MLRVAPGSRSTKKVWSAPRPQYLTLFFLLTVVPRWGLESCVRLKGLWQLPCSGISQYRRFDAEVLPLGQLLQLGLPRDGWYLPTGQSTHVPLPEDALYLPAGQSVQLAAPAAE